MPHQGTPADAHSSLVPEILRCTQNDRPEAVILRAAKNLSSLLEHHSHMNVDKVVGTRSIGGGHGKPAPTLVLHYFMGISCPHIFPVFLYACVSSVIFLLLCLSVFPVFLYACVASVIKHHLCLSVFPVFLYACVASVIKHHLYEIRL